MVGKKTLAEFVYPEVTNRIHTAMLPCNNFNAIIGFPPRPRLMNHY